MILSTYVNCLGAFVFLPFFLLMLCLLFMIIPTPRCRRLVPTSAPGRPAPPIPATSLTDRARAASRSSGAPLRGLVPGRPCRIVQPASANPDPLAAARTHPASSVRQSVGHLAANPARSGAFGSTAVGRSRARGYNRRL